MTTLHHTGPTGITRLGERGSGRFAFDEPELQRADHEATTSLEDVASHDRRSVSVDPDAVLAAHAQNLGPTAPAPSADLPDGARHVDDIRDHASGYSDAAPVACVSNRLILCRHQLGCDSDHLTRVPAQNDGQPHLNRTWKAGPGSALGSLGSLKWRQPTVAGFRSGRSWLPQFRWPSDTSFGTMDDEGSDEALVSMGSTGKPWNSD